MEVDSKNDAQDEFKATLLLKDEGKHQSST